MLGPARAWRRSGRCCATGQALTTAIYAKVDRDALRELARPWPGGAVVSALEQRLAGYLAVRRALGYKLARAEKLLAQFIAWLDERGESTITTALGARVGDAATGDRLELARRTGCRSCAASPRTCTRSTRRTSWCRPPTCCRSGRGARSPTSTPTPRSAR